MTRPRTWVLRRASDGALCAYEHENSLSGIDLGGVRVIELAPFLDAIETATTHRLELADAYGERESIEATDPLIALLKAHGRLDA